MNDPITASGIPVYCAHDEIVKIDTLKENPKNPNVHPENQIKLLAKIIKEQGWRAPITVSNRSGLITKGHGRLIAAKLNGSVEAPIDRQNYESGAAEYADMVADNRISELSHMERGLLKEILSEIDASDLEMDMTGYVESEYEAMLLWEPSEEHLPDELPPPPIEGTDDTMGKIILVYGSPDERGQWLRILKLSGSTNQVVFSLSDVGEGTEDEE